MTTSEAKPNSGSAGVPSAQELVELDRRHLVHPHQRRDRPERYVVVRGRGSTVWTADGTELLDAAGAANWLAQVGHGRPELVQAAADQLAELAYFTSFDVFSNDKSIRLAARLAALAPEGINKVFFTSGGSEGVDTAIKAARLFHNRTGQPDRTWIIARTMGYHGATYGGGTATGFEMLHHGTGPHLPHVAKVTPPWVYRAQDFCGDRNFTDHLLDELAATIEEIGPGNIAAMIGEPVMGGGGILIPPDDYWPRVREMLAANGILLIADEVVTAFGRTGVWFDSVRRGMDADIIVTAKALTSGYQPLGAVLMRDDIAEALVDEQFAHGFTYFGHPVACAVALTNLDLIEREGLVERAVEIGEWFTEHLAPLRDLPVVGDVRVAGATVGIELVADKATREPLMAGDAAREIRDAHRVVVRDYGPTLVLAPPLVFEQHEAKRVADALHEVLSRLDGDGRLAPR
ncbi:aspartate aminotransferase family protein [Actinosynnema sp. NPDC023794]